MSLYKAAETFDKIKKDIKPKKETTVGYGDVPLTAIGSSVGRLAEAINPATYLITPSMLINPSDKELSAFGLTVDDNDKKAKMYETLAKRMSSGNVDQLQDVHVNLGGGRVWNDVVRTWNNSRLNPLLRVLGTAVVPFSDFTSSLTRSDHYNPFSNTVTLYSDSPAILTHELGHAIDINSYSRPRDEEAESKQSFFPRMGTKIVRHIQNLPRDAYMMMRGLPNMLGLGTTLAQESMANIRSYENLQKVFKNEPETLKAIEVLRNKHLNPAFSTYGVAAASRLGAPITAPILYGTMLGAKALGELQNASADNSKWEATAYKEVMDALSEKERAKKKSKKPEKAKTEGAVPAMA